MKELTKYQQEFYKKLDFDEWFTTDEVYYGLSRPYFTLTKLEEAGYIESEVRCEDKIYTRYWRKKQLATNSLQVDKPKT